MSALREPREEAIAREPADVEGAALGAGCEREFDVSDIRNNVTPLNFQTLFEYKFTRTAKRTEGEIIANFGIHGRDRPASIRRDAAIIVIINGGRARNS
jgi:hypothetical protein